MSRVVMKPETGAEIPPSTVVIEAIADHEGVDPMDLDQPLFTVIDPDALDTLISTDGSGRAPADTVIQFDYNGCRVHVSSDGSVDVAPAPAE